jgi:protein TonB
MTGGWQIGARARVLAVVLLTACNGGGNDGDPDGNDGATFEEPVPLPDPTPVRYPPALWDQNVEGETEVLVSVNAVGDVERVSVAQTSGYAEFDSAAVAGARQLRFSPGKRGGKPVSMRVRIPVRFARDSTASVGAPRSDGPRND